jgi:hypothetical protein
VAHLLALPINPLGKALQELPKRRLQATQKEKTSRQPEVLK